MMKTKLQLAAFIVHFGLVFVHPSNGNGYQFWGLSTSNAEKNLSQKQIFIKTLQNEVSQSQHVFDAMKNELQKAQDMNTQRRNFYKGSNIFQENAIHKREMDSRSYNPILVNEDYIGLTKKELIEKINKKIGLCKIYFKRRFNKDVNVICMTEYEKLTNKELTKKLKEYPILFDAYNFVEEFGPDGPVSPSLFDAKSDKGDIIAALDRELAALSQELEYQSAKLAEKQTIIENVHDKIINTRPIDSRRYDYSSSSEQSDYYDDDDEDDTSSTLIRLNRFISNAGVCGRREADKLIESGDITVDGKVVQSKGTKVPIDAKVRYKGKLLRTEKRRYILLNKPKGFVSTLYDPEGRRTVLDLIPLQDCPERIYPVGRLDYDTRGLLLLTNDGELARNLSHPANEVQKFYQAVLNKPLTVEDANTIRRGVLLDDGMAHVDRVTVLEADRTHVGVIVHMGRNRIIKRILNRLGYVVESLDRIGYAHLTKQLVPCGKWIHLSERDVRKLKELARKT